MIFIVHLTFYGDLNQCMVISPPHISCTATFRLTHLYRYSVCDHGNSQNLIDHLQPLLEQHGAHYLSGHDHCMEALEHNNVHYLVSGMGDTCCYEASNLDDVPADSAKWFLSKETKVKGTSGGFTSLTATPEALTATFYDQDGATLYTTPAIAPRVVKKA